MWSPCQHTTPESTELHWSIKRFLPAVVLYNRYNITAWDLASSLLIFSYFYAAALPTRHWLSHFFDFLLEKFGTCYVGTCQFEHKTSPCRAVCLCDTTKEQRNSQSTATRSLPASKWDWFSWNAPNELSSLERYWQMDFCLVLFSVHIQGGFWELTLLRMERHQRLIPQCPTTRSTGLYMWYTLCRCLVRRN